MNKSIIKKINQQSGDKIQHPFYVLRVKIIPIYEILIVKHKFKRLYISPQQEYRPTIMFITN